MILIVFIVSSMASNNREEGERTDQWETRYMCVYSNASIHNIKGRTGPGPL